MGKTLERGTHVTVLIRNGPYRERQRVVRAVVQSGRVARMTVWYADTQTGKRRKYRVRDGASEGVEWARGWSGAAADALRAVAALR